VFLWRPSSCFRLPFAPLGSCQCHQISYRGERLIEADQLSDVCAGNPPHIILVFAGPEPIGVQPLKHAGEERFGTGRRGCLTAPADIVGGRFAHQSRKIAGANNRGLEGGEIVQCRMVVASSSLPRCLA